MIHRMKISAGVVHRLLLDLRQALIVTPAARVVWEGITPLARNEWICRVTSGKRIETRSIRIEKALSKRVFNNLCRYEIFLVRAKNFGK